MAMQCGNIVLLIISCSDMTKFITPAKIYYANTIIIKSHDGSVSIVLGYGLEDQGSRVQCLVGAGNFSLHHRVWNSSGAHPASYPMGTRGAFPRVKVAGA
jgi:hypothetical protein